MLTGKQKMDYVIRLINEANYITPPDENIRLYPNNETRQYVTSSEFSSILRRLEKFNGVIKLVRDANEKIYRKRRSGGYISNYEVSLGYYEIKVLEPFNNMMAAIEAIETRKAEANKPPAQPQVVYVSRDEQNPLMFWVEYSPKRNILLNGYLEIGKPTLGNENDLVFDYLYQHPNQVIQKEEIEKGINQTIKKDLDKIVDNLGFKRGLGKLFFEASKTTILFRNPIPKSTLEEMKLGILDAKLK